MYYEESKINEVVNTLLAEYQTGEIQSYLVSKRFIAKLTKVIREVEYQQACRDVVRRKICESDRRRIRRELGLPEFVAPAMKRVQEMSK